MNNQNQEIMADYQTTRDKHHCENCGSIYYGIDDYHECDLTCRCGSEKIADAEFCDECTEEYADRLRDALKEEN